MKLIKKLCEMIEDEIDGAEEYVELSLKLKDEDPTLARSFFNLSLQEMEHMNILHSAVVGLIESYRSEHGEPPASMQAVYDYLHERHIERAGKVKALQSLYKN